MEAILGCFLGAFIIISIGLVTLGGFIVREVLLVKKIRKRCIKIKPDFHVQLLPFIISFALIRYTVQSDIPLSRNGRGDMNNISSHFSSFIS